MSNWHTVTYRAEVNLWQFASLYFEWPMVSSVSPSRMWSWQVVERVWLIIQKTSRRLSALQSSSSLTGYNYLVIEGWQDEGKEVVAGWHWSSRKSGRGTTGGWLRSDRRVAQEEQLNGSRVEKVAWIQAPGLPCFHFPSYILFTHLFTTRPFVFYNSLDWHCRLLGF